MQKKIFVTLRLTETERIFSLHIVHFTAHKQSVCIAKNSSYETRSINLLSLYALYTTLPGFPLTSHICVISAARLHSKHGSSTHTLQFSRESIHWKHFYLYLQYSPVHKLQTDQPHFWTSQVNLF